MAKVCGGLASIFFVVNCSLMITEMPQISAHRQLEAVKDTGDAVVMLQSQASMRNVQDKGREPELIKGSRDMKSHIPCEDVDCDLSAMKPKDLSAVAHDGVDLAAAQKELRDSKRGKLPVVTKDGQLVSGGNSAYSRFQTSSQPLEQSGAKQSSKDSKASASQDAASTEGGNNASSPDEARAEALVVALAEALSSEDSRVWLETHQEGGELVPRSSFSAQEARADLKSSEEVQAEALAEAVSESDAAAKTETEEAVIRAETVPMNESRDGANATVALQLSELPTTGVFTAVVVLVILILCIVMGVAALETNSGAARDNCFQVSRGMIGRPAPPGHRALNPHSYRGTPPLAAICQSGTPSASRSGSRDPMADPDAVQRNIVPPLMQGAQPRNVSFALPSSSEPSTSTLKPVAFPAGLMSPSTSSTVPSTRAGPLCKGVQLPIGELSFNIAMDNLEHPSGAFDLVDGGGRPLLRAMMFRDPTTQFEVASILSMEDVMLGAIQEGPTDVTPHTMEVRGKNGLYFGKLRNIKELEFMFTSNGVDILRVQLTASTGLLTVDCQQSGERMGTASVSEDSVGEHLNVHVGGGADVVLTLLCIFGVVLFGSPHEPHC